MAVIMIRKMADGIVIVAMAAHHLHPKELLADRCIFPIARLHVRLALLLYG